MVINAILQDSTFVYWGLTSRGMEGQPWLQPNDFRTPLLADMYEVLANAALSAPSGYVANCPATLYEGLWSLYCSRAEQGDAAARKLISDQNAWTGTGGLWEFISHLKSPDIGNPSSAHEHAVEIWNESPRREPLAQAPPPPGNVQADIQTWGALSIVGAVLNDPRNVEAFRYQPQDPTASPYWLQGEDFEDEFLNLTWQVLVTGPNAVINSEAANDPYLVGDERAFTLTRLAVGNMQDLLAQRSSTDPTVAQALSDPTFWERIEHLLVQAQSPSLAQQFPPTNIARRARELVLDPHVRNYVAQIGEHIDAETRTAGPVGHGLLATLARSVAALHRLRERVANAAAPASPQNRSVLLTKTETSYAAPGRERAIIDAALHTPDLMQSPQYQALQGEDFTVREHGALFEAMQRHPTPWHPLLLVQEAHLTGANPGDLDGELMVTIASAAYSGAPRTAPVMDGGPYDPRVMAQQLVTVTLRRSTEQASTVVTKAAYAPQVSADALLNIAAQQYTQAAQSALRYNPTPGQGPRQSQQSQPQSATHGQFVGV
ncbi:hypothetical protein PUR49_11190 [Streptomyces sp. BE147]|uniref:hypothetical protein n=1 Tax=Streptomyces sp. BE147 TaxID=3002524 RepID=UPI002E791D68|nr:hypothetical protein [Streptomyces sp. BE147]MEE1737060.1 hypothetical protein [Streptomyces sp. BE147]